MGRRVRAEKRELKEMATLATFFRRMEPIADTRDQDRQRTAREAAAAEAEDALALSGLPNDDVFFYFKRIDNTRLVRQADPQAKGECWSAIGAVCAVALAIGSMIAPSVAGIMDSYRIQDLKQEQAKLRTERRKLDVEEETLLSAARLDTLAGQHNLVRPAADQVIRLQPKSDRSFAMNEMMKSR
jgi:hypothetical protein